MYVYPKLLIYSLLLTVNLSSLSMPLSVLYMSSFACFLDSASVICGFCLFLSDLLHLVQ